MKVLFATDGSKPSVDAALLLEKIADRTAVDVSVLGVTTFEILTPKSPIFISDSVETRKAHVREVVDATVARLVAAGFRADGIFAEGSPGQQIVKTAEQESADLIVLGAGSRNWLSNLLLGSASTFVIHNAPTSVLVAHEASDEGIGRIVVAVDGSEGSRLGVETIASLADPERATIHVFAVAPVPSALFVPFPGLVPTPMPRTDTEQERALFEHAEASAAAAVSRLTDAGFTAEAEVVSGSPTSEILRVAEGEGADLVVMGSRGLGPVRRALLGSVSDQVSRLAKATLVARKED